MTVMLTALADRTEPRVLDAKLDPSADERSEPALEVPTPDVPFIPGVKRGPITSTGRKP